MRLLILSKISNLHKLQGYPREIYFFVIVGAIDFDNFNFISHIFKGSSALLVAMLLWLFLLF